MGQVQLAHGAGQAHVAEAPLFGHAAWLLAGHLVGEQTFLHATDEYRRKFQPLGGMQGHHLHRVLVGVGLALAGFQGGVVEKGCQAVQFGVFILVTEFPGGGDQFAQVFQTLLALFALFLAVEIHQATGFDYMFGGFRQRQAIALLLQLRHQVQEHRQGIGGPGGK